MKNEEETKVLQEAESIICDAYIKHLEETNFGIPFDGDKELYGEYFKGSLDIRIKDLLDIIPKKVIAIIISTLLVVVLTELVVGKKRREK